MRLVQQLFFHYPPQKLEAPLLVTYCNEQRFASPPPPVIFLICGGKEGQDPQGYSLVIVLETPIYQGLEFCSVNFLFHHTLAYL